eukprot:g12274.t1
MHDVHSVMLTWPDYVKPSEAFIQKYDTFVPDIVQLAKHNIFVEDVQEALRWIKTLQTLPLPTPLTYAPWAAVRE